MHHRKPEQQPGLEHLSVYSKNPLLSTTTKSKTQKIISYSYYHPIFTGQFNSNVVKR